MKNKSVMTAVIAIILLTVYRLAASIRVEANYSPNTGDTAMIIFIILGVVAVGVLIFLSTRRKR